MAEAGDNYGREMEQTCQNDSDEEHLFYDASEAITDTNIDEAICKKDTIPKSRKSEDRDVTGSDYEGHTEPNIQRSLLRSDSCIDLCPIHDGKKIRYRCAKCNILGCSACVNLMHKDCKVDYIPNLVLEAGFELDVKCAKFLETISITENRIKIKLARTEANLTAVKLLKENAMSDIRKTRKEINLLCDRLENDFQKDIEDMEGKETDKLDTIFKRQNQMAKKLEAIKGEYHRRVNDGHKSSIYTSIHMAATDVDRFNEELDKLDTDNTVTKYVYDSSDTVKNFMANVKHLGTIEKLDSAKTHTIIQKTQIQVKQDNDQKSCKISGLAVLRCGDLVAVDCTNNTVKLINADTYETVAVTRLPAELLDVAIVDDKNVFRNTNTVNATDNGSEFIETLAITLTKENKILLVNVTLSKEIQQFSIGESIPVNGPCRSVAYYKGQLFVTFPSKGKIEITDMKGNMLTRITNETIGRALFEPQFIAIGVLQGLIYVTEKVSHAVLCMSSAGIILNSFTDDDLLEPRGICTDISGSVFVCSLSGGRIFHLTEDCRLVYTDEGCSYPYSIAYCRHRNVLYCGRFAADCITAYQLK